MHFSIPSALLIAECRYLVHQINVTYVWKLENAPVTPHLTFEIVQITSQISSK